MMNLSWEQRAAVESDAAHKVVIAGAGSGKTRVIVAQVGRWLSQGVDPSTTVVITFTRRAGEELRRRIADEYNASLGYIGTVHGMAYTAMYLAGDPLTPLTEVECRAVVDHVAAQTRMKSAVCPKVYRGAAGETVAHLDPGPRALLAAVRAYMQSTRVCPVGDLVRRFRLRLGDSAGLLSRFAADSTSLLWDEYQDTTDDEAALAATMGAERSVVVGDPRQTIFGFRGSASRHLLARTAERHLLRVNYRNSAPIVDAANALQGAWPAMVTFRTDPGWCAKHYPNPDEFPSQATARVVAGMPRPVTVLCRTNREIVEVSQCLALRGTKVTISSPGFDAFAAPPWPDLYLACRHVIDPTCEWAASRVRETGIGSTRLYAVDPARTPAGEVLAAIHPDAANAMHGMEPLGMPVLDFIRWYQRRDLECMTPVPGTADVVLMTAHAAKGLEFPHVCLHAVGRGLGRDLDDPEERNLLYVAATRARDALVMVGEKSAIDKIFS